MKKLLTLAGSAALASFLLLSSCKDKGKINPDNEGIDDFMPTKVENWWRYEANDGTVFKRYYTGRDTNIQGFNYNYYEQVNVNNGTIVKEFYGKFEGNYYTLLKINDEGTLFVQAKVLNEDPKVGDTWTNAGDFEYSGVAFSAKVDGEVVSISETATVNGLVLNDIVKVKSRLFAKVPAGEWIDCGTVEMKIKKGVGIISEDYDIHVGTWVNKIYKNWLLEYHIEP